MNINILKFIIWKLLKQLYHTHEYFSKFETKNDNFHIIISTISIFSIRLFSDFPHKFEYNIFGQLTDIFS